MRVGAGRSMVKVVTYNIHKCVGIDRRRSVDRIARVLREIDADVVALQEVVTERVNGPDPHHRNQARTLADLLGMTLINGPAIVTEEFLYGNVVLTRLPVLDHENFDISCQRREPRACMRVDLELPTGPLHFFNTHLGTTYSERCEQSRKLTHPQILLGSHPEHPQVLVGDFNDWFAGRPTRMLGDHMHDLSKRLRPSYPGVLPFLRLDRVYVNRHVHCRDIRVHRSRLSHVASDHMPLVATIGCDVTEGHGASGHEAEHRLETSTQRR